MGNTVERSSRLKPDKQSEESPTSQQNLKMVERKVGAAPCQSYCFSFNFAPGSNKYTIYHRQREKKNKTQVIRYKGNKGVLLDRSVCVCVCMGDLLKVICCSAKVLSFHIQPSVSRRFIETITSVVYTRL